VKLGRYIHTFRYLRFAQVVGQVRQRLPLASAEFAGRSPKPGLDFVGPEAGLPGAVSALPPNPPVQSPDRIRAGEFTFLNRTRALGWPPRWEPPGCPKLWIYNLHYFNWLESLDYSDCREAVADWIERYPSTGRAAGWEPYPVSVRLINWLRTFYGKYFSRLQADASFRKVIEKSIGEQAYWLSRRLEFRLLGNHLMENAVALVMVGNLFGGRAAESWYRRGLKILEREIGEQVLADGLHFELSPMYHLRATWLMLLLAVGGGGEAAKPPAGLVERMLTALDRLTHPDGEIALLADSALEIYPPPESLRLAAEKIIGRTLPREGQEPGGWALPDAGYFGFREGEGNYLVCDAGRIGPDYIPAHGHGDIFSFELSLRGRRVVVDSGVSGYEPGPERDYDRSTLAHNTVEISGVDQAEFWGAFRVARRGRPREIRWRAEKAEFFLEGHHDGYRRLPGSPIHRRSFRFKPGGFLEVNDRIAAAREVGAVSRIHLHPDCRIEERGPGGVIVSHPGGRVKVEFIGPGELGIEGSSYSPRFGRRRGNIALAYRSRGSEIENGFRIVPLP
jgi:uncharacterized heparinase superfamily protein